jgi:1A family penicillin-binding protein
MSFVEVVKIQFKKWQRSLEISLAKLATTLKLEEKSAFYRLMRRKVHSRRSLSPEEKKLQRIKNIRLLALAFLGMVLLGIVLFIVMFIYYSKDLPQPGKVLRQEGFSSKIYDRDGSLLYDLYDEEKRVPIEIDQVPQSLKDATVAIEDKDFYKHKGFDFLTILRIPYNFIFRGGRVVGGSTLTQQLVKNALLSNERTLPRKFKELVLAIQIERKFSKDEILEMYLNESPYVGNSYGVAAAVETYFNKPVQDLSVLESAFLAGLPQSPSLYSPYSGRLNDEGQPYWKLRTTAVLNAMRDNGYITDLAYQDALSQMDSLTFQSGTDAATIKAPHFVFYVRQQLVDMFGEELLKTGGLKVTTSLDWELQEKAQEAVTEEVDAVEKYKISNGAAMVMDPQTGEILAMVGSKDYFNSDIGGQYNVAVDALRQPGSSIKPITYLAMIQRGYNPSSLLMDVETTFVENDKMEPYTPKNYDGKFHGPVTLRQSLGSSLNIPAVKSLAIVGLKNWLTLAYTMGLSTLEPTDTNLKTYGLSATLGGAEVHMIDLISAYSTFANGGLKVQPVSILKVEDKDGKVLYEYKPVEKERVISSGEAFIINNILSDNTARMLAFGANSLLNTGKPIAVKTGTTNNMKDNWTIGWSQNVIVASWVGNNDGSEMSYVASGITGASPIWRRIINEALNLGYKAPAWEVPDEVEELDVDAISGYRAHDDFPSKKEYVIKGSLPNTPDPVHRKVNVCKGDEGKLATDAKVAVGDFTEKEFVYLQEDDPVSQDGRNRWQEGIDAWIAGQTDPRYHTPNGYCGESSDVSVSLLKPNNETRYDSNNIEVQVKAGSDDGIDKVEIFVDGNVARTVEDKLEFTESLSLSTGRHQIYVKAYSRGGKTATSGTAKIGVNTDWQEPTPTPSPTPTMVVLPTATPTAPLSPVVIP